MRRLLSLRVPVELIEKYKELSKVTNVPYQKIMLKALTEFSQLPYTENCFTPIIKIGETNDQS